MTERDEPQRKRRTREHVIEDLSENYLERMVLSKGHLLRRPARDYGVDVTMFHFSENGEIENGEIENGEIENGEVRFQLKATERLRVIKQGSVISFPIRATDLHYWSMEIYPFILVVFDAKNANAYWVHVQEYVVENPDRVDLDTVTSNIHIPISNKLTIQSIEHFRELSLQTIEQFRNRGDSPDVKRTPK